MLLPVAYAGLAAHQPFGALDVLLCVAGLMEKRNIECPNKWINYPGFRVPNVLGSLRVCNAYHVYEACKWQYRYIATSTFCCLLSSCPLIICSQKAYFLLASSNSLLPASYFLLRLLPPIRFRTSFILPATTYYLLPSTCFLLLTVY